MYFLYRPTGSGSIAASVFEHTLEQHGTWQGEIWSRKECGTLFCSRRCVSAIYNDSLTGLPNRSLLLDRLKQAIALASE